MDSYDKISNYLLNLIDNLTQNIKLMDGIIDELLMVQKINKNIDFLKFIIQFNEVKYYNYKSQGYLECLIITKYYTYPIICYLVNDLTILINHFKEANLYLENLKAFSPISNNEDFIKLIDEASRLRLIINSTKEVLSYFNLPCN